MQILLFGVTGFTGRHLTNELLARGHEVLGAARRIADAEVPDGAILVAADVHDADAVAALAADADAIVVAVPALTEDGDRLADALPGLLTAAAMHGARLGIVGGASSLRRGPDGPRLIDDRFPEEWKPTALALIEVLDALRASGTDVDWFFVSPPENYGAYQPGERRGAYRTGVDELVVADDGRSHIGGEDFAAAFVDELETPAHHRMRFTVGY